MSVLVTGGAGFIGSNLVDELLRTGHEVTVYDNFSEGKMENLIKHKNLEVIRGDILDFKLLMRACAHKKWIFHLAAQARIQPSITEPIHTVEQNILGTLNVLEAARRNGVSRVVYSASSSAYGLKNKSPLKEDMETDCLNPYSLSKKTGEELCKLYNDLYGLSTISLRYFNVYGPKHQESGAYATVVAIFMKQVRYRQPMTVVGDGEQKRDFTFVTDVVKANIMAAMNKNTGIVNIGTGTNYTINQIAHKVADVYGVEPNIQYIEERPGEARETLADNTKAVELGWGPQVDLDTGLDITKRFQDAVSPIIM